MAFAINVLKNKKLLSWIFLSVAMLSFLLPLIIQAQSVQEEIVKARVLEVLQEKQDARDINLTTQNLYIRLEEGKFKNQEMEFKNDRPIALKKNDTFFLSILTAPDGEKFYSLRDINRLPAILFFLILFVAVVLIFGRRQGFYSLLALSGSFFIIFYILFPIVLKGISPLLISAAVSWIILFLAMMVTHGINKKTGAAFLGTTIAILITIILAEISVRATNLSGLVDEAIFYLNLETDNILDFRGLLLGAMIIGVLGILDDVAITQATAVQEISSASHFSRRDVYKKAMNIGREHVGALVNTLALAYTGAAFPLLLFFFKSNMDFLHIINSEIIATEIIRSVVGSIGIIFAVPVTTFIATILLTGKSDKL